MYRFITQRTIYTNLFVHFDFTHLWPWKLLEHLNSICMNIANLKFLFLLIMMNPIYLKLNPYCVTCAQFSAKCFPSTQFWMLASFCEQSVSCANDCLKCNYKVYQNFLGQNLHFTIKNHFLLIIWESEFWVFILFILQSSKCFIYITPCVINLHNAWVSFLFVIFTIKSRTLIILLIPLHFLVSFSLTENKTQELSLDYESLCLKKLKKIC